jgi:formylglycine-generating enzyme required for sulfatase activity
MCVLRAAVIVLLIVLLPSPARAEGRIALLIGNEAYGNEIGRLANPHNDVALLEQALKGLGFEVVTVHDASLGALTRAVNAYARRLQAAGPNVVGFFYYSGHGASDGTTNYLIPIDVKTTETGELWDESLRLTEITRRLKAEAGNATHFVVFDACRNTLKLTQPGSRAVVQSKGFVPVAQENGMLIAYATAEGELASDVGPDAGPFAKALAEEIVKPGIEAVTMFRRVQVRVRALVGQEPWLGFSALREVHLGGGVEGPKPPSIDALIEECVKDRVHPNGAEIAARLARALEQRPFEYVWQEEDPSKGTKQEFAYEIRAVSNNKEQLQIGYDWQNGSVRLKVVAPRSRATRSIRPIDRVGPPGTPGTDLEGIWLQDNSFGCLQLRLSEGGEGAGMWGVWTGPLDSPVFVRLKQTAAAQIPTPPATLGTPKRCDGIKIAVGQDERRCFKPGAGKTEWFKDCPACPEMVVVPAGSFTMGSPASEPERSVNEDQVRVSIPAPFAVGKFAVTFDEWDGCVADSGCNGYRPNDFRGGRGKRPVIGVNWDDAKAYAAWVSRKTGKTYRLLSEAEREYVTRAGTTTPFWWGSSITPKQANYDGRVTVPVDIFEPNPWGLYNVHGNVWEWIEDCWNDSNNGNPGDGSARKTSNCSQRMVRGGSWVDNPRYLRSATRSWGFADIRYDSRGFRLARTLNP